MRIVSKAVLGKTNTMAPMENLNWFPNFKHGSDCVLKDVFKVTNETLVAYDNSAVLSKLVDKGLGASLANATRRPFRRVSLLVDSNTLAIELNKSIILGNHFLPACSVLLVSPKTKNISVIASGRSEKNSKSLDDCSSVYVSTTNATCNLMVDEFDEGAIRDLELIDATIFEDYPVFPVLKVTIPQHVVDAANGLPIFIKMEKHISSDYRHLSSSSANIEKIRIILKKLINMSIVVNPANMHNNTVYLVLASRYLDYPLMDTEDCHLDMHDAFINSHKFNRNEFSGNYNADLEKINSVIDITHTFSTSLSKLENAEG